MSNFIKNLKNYFIPHEGNDYKPHSLRHRSFFVLFAVIILVELAFLAQVFLVFDKTKFLAAVLPGVLTALTNEDRKDYNAPALKTSTLLEQAAQLKANDMASRGYFSHNTPEGRLPWYWLEQVGYKYAYAGENLAVNFFESEDVAKAWMDSPSHKENIVKKNYTEIGIAVASGIYEGRDSVFVVQFFGTPLSTPVTNPTPIASAKVETQKATVTTNEIPKEAQKPTPTPKPTTPTTTPPKPATPIKTIAEAPIQNNTQEEETLGATNETPQTPEILSIPPFTATFIAKISNVKNSFVLFVNKVLSSPRESSSYVFGLLGTLVFISLLLALFIRSEIRHPAILARGVGLIAIIAVLSFANLQISQNQTKIPIEGGAETFIAS